MVEFLYILDISALSDACFANIFSQLWPFYFYSPYGILCRAECFNEVHFVSLFFYKLSGVIS